MGELEMEMDFFPFLYYFCGFVFVGVGRRSVTDLLLPGLRLGGSHHHGFLQQVPQ